MQTDFAAFLSYSHFDDEHDAGYLTQLCERLSREVRAQTGRAFPIFQDKKDIPWGQIWNRRIENALDGTTFLIPIISPSFFTSEACRSELLTFKEREQQLGRDDLILPIYYIDSVRFKEDELGKIIFDRQYEDWRELRFEHYDSREFRKQIERLAVKIRDAMRILQETQSTKSIIDAGILNQTSQGEIMPLQPDSSRKEPLDHEMAESEMKSLLPDDIEVAETIRCNVSGAKYKDIAVKAQSKDEQTYVCILSYNEETSRWINAYHKIVAAITVTLIPHRMQDGRTDFLIITGTSGSGHYLSYTILGYIDKKIKIILERGGIFQGSLQIHGNQIIEKLGHQATLFQWNGAFMVGIPLVIEPHAPYSLEDYIITFSIDGDENVTVFTGETGSHTPSKVTLRVGQNLLLLRVNTGVSERILYGGGVLTYKEDHFAAVAEGTGSITIVPSGYTWKKAVEIQVEII